MCEISNDDDENGAYDPHSEQNLVRHGYGRYRLPEGAGVYEGNFRNGVVHGFGSMTWHYPVFKKYVGEWKEGSMHGHGLLFAPFGSGA